MVVVGAVPLQVAAYVARDAKLLRQFFRDQPRRVVLFFEHFSMSGEFTYGARALSRFAFARRCAALIALYN